MAKFTTEDKVDVLLKEDLQSESSENFEEEEEDVPADSRPKKPVAPALHAVFLDLLADYSSCDRILLDGDSLLLQAFAASKGKASDEDFDWETSNGQVLHVVYYVEALLSRLRDRGARFDIVFFTANRALFEGCPARLACREAVIRHLKVSPEVLQSENLAGMSIDSRDLRPTMSQFDHWLSPEWEAYVRELGPTFVVIYDGWVRKEWMREMLLLQISHFLIQGYHVVYPSRISFQGNHAHAFTVRVESSVTRYARHIISGFCQKHGGPSKLGQFTDAGRKAVLSAMASRAPLPELDAKAKWPVDNKSPFRLSLGAIACASSAPSGKEADRHWAFARIFMAHLALLDVLPLSLRALRGTASPSDEAKAFINRVAAKLTEHVRADGPAPKDLGQALIDLFDLRLFYRLCADASQDASMFATADAFFGKQAGGKEAGAAATAAWKAAGCASALFPLAAKGTSGLCGWDRSAVGARFRRLPNNSDDDSEEFLLEDDDGGADDGSGSSHSEDEPVLPVDIPAFKTLGIGAESEDSNRDLLGVPTRSLGDPRVQEINSMPDYRDIFHFHAGKQLEENDNEVDPEDEEEQLGQEEEFTTAELQAQKREEFRKSVGFQKFCAAEKDKNFKGRPSAWEVIGDHPRDEPRRQKLQDKLLGIYMRRNDKKKERRRQKYASYMQAYSQSLEGFLKYRTKIADNASLEKMRQDGRIDSWDLYAADPGHSEYALGDAQRPPTETVPPLLPTLDLPYEVETREVKPREAPEDTGPDEAAQAAAAAVVGGGAADGNDDAAAAEAAAVPAKKGKPHTQAEKDAIKAALKKKKEEEKAAKKGKKGAQSKGKEKDKGKGKGKEKEKAKGKDKKKGGKGPVTKEEMKAENTKRKAAEHKEKMLQTCSTIIRNTSSNEAEAVRQIREFASSINVEDAVARWAWVRAKVHELKLQRKRLKIAQSDGRDTATLVAAILRTVYEIGDRLNMRAPDPALELGELKMDEREVAEVDGAVADALKVEGVAPEQRFQLRHMGHLLRRTTEGRPDARTKFVPDAWQRRLLDAVDNRESCVVCAPTSSGKTFVSYYCMEKVLRESDDGVVVYVAPTKSLANQVAAEVIGRFEKPYPSGRTVYSIFTREYKENDPMNCQVLVTIPSMLEILLMSPTTQSAEWRRNLRYVIFDEVHNIGVQEESSAWEHLLLLIRCPFLALSATVGNPDEFAAWLHRNQTVQFIQEATVRSSATDKIERGYTTTLVAHNERWSDLQKYIYLPKYRDERYLAKGQWKDMVAVWAHDDVVRDKEAADGGASTGALGEFVTIHPLSVVSMKGVAAGGFPASVSFVPRDSVVFAETMLKAAESMTGKGAEVALMGITALLPENYFPPKLGISRRDAKAYEHKLKTLFVQWSRDPDTLPVATKTRDILDEQFSSMLASTSVGLPEGLLTTSDKYISMNFVPMLQSLQEQKMLPALVFSFRRDLCLRLVELATVELEEAEKESRNYPGYEEAVKVAQKTLKQLERSATKMAARSTKRDDPDSKMDERDGDEDTGELAAARRRLAALTGVDPRFSFVREGRVSEAQVTEMIEENLGKLKWPDDHILLRALRRGLGVHHAGMPKKYRHLVEVLFRTQYLKVVVATNTLAQGIHMPCRTSIFCGDSHQLDSVNFHQMSGRAGRRGFDDLGHVVFFGLPRQKIETLMTADLPILRGEFPITPSTTLRLVMMHEQVRRNVAEFEEKSKKDVYGYKKDLVFAKEEERMVTNAVECLFHEPLFALSTPGQRAGKQLRHHVRFSLEFLMRARCISSGGQVVDLAGLAAHLYLAEPSNFLMIDLLRSGIFDDICAPVEDAAADSPVRAEAQRAVITILCHLFGGVPLHEAAGRARARNKEALGQVVLPSLAEVASDASAGERTVACVRNYNARILRHICNYLRLYSRQIDSGRTETQAVGIPGLIGASPQKITKSQLPFSRMDFPCASVAEAAAAGGVAGALAKGCVRYRARSPFSALTGVGDRDFESMVDLVDNLRADVYLDESAVPLKDVATAVGPRGSDATRLLNAYVLDFFTHGQKQDLTRANGLREGDAWELLNQFDQILSAITGALVQMPTGYDEGCVKPYVKTVFRELRKDFLHKFRNFNVET